MGLSSADVDICVSKPDASRFEGATCTSHGASRPMVPCGEACTAQRLRCRPGPPLQLDRSYSSTGSFFSFHSRQPPAIEVTFL